MAKHLAVKQFEKFQHYKDRNPPWIKLYASVLTDLAFLQLPEAAQAQLLKLWILASQLGNPLPNNPKLLAGKIGTTGRFYLREIIAGGFLIPCEGNASGDASKDSGGVEQNASGSVRVREEGELERELETTPPPQRARTGVEGLLAIVPNRHIWEAEIDAMLAGMGGHVKATPAQVERAATDYLGNGASSAPNIRQFRRYVEGAVDRSPNLRAKSTKAPQYKSNALEEVPWAK